ncbi:MAG: uracil-xanthine permease family protein [Syntrophomonadaceae bacterium]
MELKYKLEETPGWKENLLYGLQWLAVSLPAIIIIGKVLGSITGSLMMEAIYLQKVFAVTGVAMLMQIYWGHGLPLVIGPATVLLIGILASQDSTPAASYSSISISGIILTLLAVTGLFARLQSLFTPRVVAVILLLVAFTITPTIVDLISNNEGASSSHHLAFTFVFVLLIFIGQRYLTGLLKSLLILLAAIAGSLGYFLVNPAWTSGANATELRLVSSFTQNFSPDLVFNPGVLIAFLFCFIGLSINDLGSIQAVGSVLKADNMPQRINRGITATGVTNILAGFLGVIGPVNFSFSPGVIASTGCAARRSLVPAAIALLILAFMPRVLFYISCIPSVVIGTLLLYIMCTQVAAGLTAAFDALDKLGEPHFDNTLVISLPILAAIIVAFLPQEVTASFPITLQPVLSNGFVVGIVLALLLEHIIFRK